MIRGSSDSESYAHLNGKGSLGGYTRLGSVNTERMAGSLLQGVNQPKRSILKNSRVNYNNSNPSFLLNTSKDTFSESNNPEEDKRKRKKEPESFYSASLKTVLADNSVGRRTEQEFRTNDEDLINPKSVRRFALLCASGGFYFGYYMSIFNPLSKPVLTGVYGITDKDYISAKSNVAMIFSLGAMVGCVYSSYSSEKIGFFKTMVFGVVLELFCYSLYAIEQYEVLLISR